MTDEEAAKASSFAAAADEQQKDPTVDHDDSKIKIKSILPDWIDDDDDDDKDDGSSIEQVSSTGRPFIGLCPTKDIPHSLALLEQLSPDISGHLWSHLNIQELHSIALLSRTMYHQHFRHGPL